MERKYPNKDNLAELANLYHLARTAGAESRYDRMCWAAKFFAKAHPDWSANNAYLAVEEAIHIG